MTGGAYDVDAVIYDPKEKKLYEKTKSTYDTLQFQTEHEGVYTVCFSNEFSTFTHKLVYMELRVGEDAPLQGLEQQITVMTQVNFFLLMLSVLAYNGKPDFLRFVH